MTYFIVTFVSVFVLVGSLLFLLFYKESLGSRLEDVLWLRDEAEPGVENDSLLPSKIRKMLETLGSLTTPKQKATGDDDVDGGSPIEKRLGLAGFRADDAVPLFGAAKILTPVLVCGLLVVTGLYLYSPFIILIVAFGVGYLLPDYWLDYRIKGREDAVRRGVPDLIDLLVVCLEAGLSLDQAGLRSCEELRHTAPELADEMSIVILEVRAGQTRLEAWKHMAARNHEESVRGLVSIVIQSEQFGTSMSKALRTHGDALRGRRRQRAEELTAKSTVKLVFPLVFCIFPSFFIVLLGGAVIALAEGMGGF